MVWRPVTLAGFTYTERAKENLKNVPNMASTAQ